MNLVLGKPDVAQMETQLVPRKSLTQDGSALEWTSQMMIMRRQYAHLSSLDVVIKENTI